jgi:NAD-dependent deacetylase
MDDGIRAMEMAVRWLRGGGTVALTGAGISVDSGIPDFRSPGGLWERYEPAQYATIDAFRSDPDRVWRMLREMGEMIAASRPNAGHTALAQLERAGKLDAVITQNVDDLHQAAGSSRVIEFHGNARDLRCVDCGARSRPERPPQGTASPRCATCGGLLRPLVVFFGEPIPTAALVEATELARRCRTMLVVGTSATVAPASLLPVTAKESGARVIEVNLEPTALSWLADLSLTGRSATELLPELVRRATEE